MSVLDPVRVENPAGPGTPDVNFGGVIDGERLEGWIELKWIRDAPLGDLTPVRVDHFTAQQKIWLRRRWKRGGFVLLLIQVSRSWFLLDGATAARRLGHATMSELEEIAIGHWPNGLDKKGLIECLRANYRKANVSTSNGSGKECGNP